MTTRQYITQLKNQRHDLRVTNHELWQELSEVEQENAQLHELVTTLINEGLTLMRQAQAQQRDVFTYTAYRPTMGDSAHGR